MRKARIVMAALVLFAGIGSASSSRAQDKVKNETKAPVATLKMQVTISEAEGEKKVVNLPYTFYLRVGEQGPVNPWTKVRMGSRVPVYVGKDGGMQYIDVGTNIDARGFVGEDGRFDINLSLERSWVEGDVAVPMERPTGQQTEAHTAQFREPVIRQFKTELALTMKDGQTIQSTMATDPLSGKVLAINVTMNVVK
ncbi:MAG TPA: hypothetical protein VK728_13780 [Candidatus Sulfotelmatobacter sp.]|jgi:hypothetical protein|nr:hypothetical protein [Candidatus Sulfotelmatobacter sp.]